MIYFISFIIIKCLSSSYVFYEKHMILIKKKMIVLCTKKSIQKDIAQKKQW